MDLVCRVDYRDSAVFRMVRKPVDIVTYRALLRCLYYQIYTLDFLEKVQK